MALSWQSWFGKHIDIFLLSFYLIKSWQIFFLIFKSWKKDYQPGWTLVGGGLKTADQVRRHQKDLIPSGVDWIKTNAASFDPVKNSVTLANGNKVYTLFLF